MDVVLYSDDPKIESKIIKVVRRCWGYTKYLNINDKHLPEILYFHTVVIKGRWPEVEEIIKKDPYFWNLYTTRFSI